MVFRTMLFENGVVRLEFRANYTRLNNGVWGKGSPGALGASRHSSRLCTPTKYFALVVKLAKTAVSKAVSESIVGSSPTWGTIVSWVASFIDLINRKISAIVQYDFVLSR